MKPTIPGAQAPTIPGAQAPTVPSAQAPTVPGAIDPISKRRILLVVALFAVFGVGLHVLAPTINGMTFNGIKLTGLPLGYWIAAQLGPLLLALLVVWLSKHKASS